MSDYQIMQSYSVHIEGGSTLSYKASGTDEAIYHAKKYITDHSRQDDIISAKIFHQLIHIYTITYVGTDNSKGVWSVQQIVEAGN